MSMDNRTLMQTGAVGAVITAICCATPLLAVVLGTVGLAAWAAKADYVLLPVIALCVGLVAWALIQHQKQKESH